MRRSYTDELKEKIGKEVLVAGWCHDVRLIGGINFLLLRDGKGMVQVTAQRKKVPAEVLKIYQKLRQEDVIKVRGKVVKSKIARTGIEIIPSEIEIIRKAGAPLPLDPRWVTPANPDTRFEWRSLDLRRPEIQAIFKIQAKIVEGMREYLRKNGYVEVFTPCLIGGTSEGGADVFKIDYFGKEAFLRQDPQLHRQLLILGGFEKIFDLGPNWRAEPSHTTRHLCEYRACAVELAFIKDEKKVEEELVTYVIKKIIKECKDELNKLEVELRVPRKFPELRFPKVYEILKEMGKDVPFGEDYDRESEILLWKYVKEKYKTDFFFVNHFPFKAKPFYVMRIDEEPQWARSVDLLFKGIEQSSGGQREHRYEKIVEQIKEKGLSLERMKWFTEPFKYGAPPHGGFCIGIERFMFPLLNLRSVQEASLFPRVPDRFLP